MIQLSGILFQMSTMDTDDLFSFRSGDGIQPSNVMGIRIGISGNLWEGRDKNILTGKNTAFGDVQCSATGANGIFHRLFIDHWQGSGMPRQTGQTAVLGCAWVGSPPGSHKTSW
jgi:hypothetical protein